MEEPARRLTQPALFSAPTIRPLLISRRRDFEGLFQGYSRLRAVSFVASPTLLLELLEVHGYSQVEIVVGERLIPGAALEGWREELLRDDRARVKRLAELVAQGRLRVLLPERMIHSKLYLLDGEAGTRVIATSANLTEAARTARQVNHAVVFDFPCKDPLLARFEEDYRAHQEETSLFMGDLVELLQAKADRPGEEVLEAWLRGTAGRKTATDAALAFQDIVALAMQEPEPALPAAAAATVSIHLPESPAVRRQVEKAAGVVASGNELTLHRASFLRRMEASHGLPLFRIDVGCRSVLTSLEGAPREMAEPLPSPAGVDEALAHLEAYVATVDGGQSADPGYAKAALFEALLYVLFSPFASEYMRRRRASYRAVDKRGPRVLYIHGDSQNGKSTFLRFALKLLARRPVDPLPGAQFTRTRLQEAAGLGTAFPLVFDDVVGVQRAPGVEDAVKSWWEVWWRPELTQPLILLSSNERALKAWARSRVKRIDFDVHFPPEERGKRELARLFEADNPLFSWFAWLYLGDLAQASEVADDELATARRVMRDLYRHAGRPLPACFPRAPLESLYDPGLREWKDLLEVLKKARVTRERGLALVEFASDVQHWEVRAYQTHLPPAVKVKQKGNTLVIESPEVFERWMGRTRRSLWSWLVGLFRLRADSRRAG